MLDKDDWCRSGGRGPPEDAPYCSYDLPLPPVLLPALVVLLLPNECEYRMGSDWGVAGPLPPPPPPPNQGEEGPGLVLLPPGPDLE